MPIPSREACLAAVENPANFGLPILRTMRAARELDTGRVMAWPGAFGIVVRMDGAGGVSRAVKCFTTAHKTRTARYGAIADHLDRLFNGGSDAAQYLVECCYAPKGLLVGSSWQPVLMMEWVDGESINRHVGALCAQPNPGPALSALARRWTDLALALRAGGVAHGDLQHGNVIVLPDGQLKLIDYDGMCVPALAGRYVVEGGHPNYQHPKRSVHFTERLDAFSTLVILTALVALSVRPELWAKYDQGRNMLFQESDFRAPDQSPLLAELRNSGHPAVDHVVGALRRATFSDSLEGVPTLESVTSPLSF